MPTLLGSNTSKNQSLNQPTVEDLLSFFNSKIASVQQAIEGMPAESNLPPSPAVFDSFEPYSADEIGKIISATPTKSCSLDPLPTHILKEFLPELLPIIVDIIVQYVAREGLSAAQSTPRHRHHASRRLVPTKVM